MYHQAEPFDTLLGEVFTSVVKSTYEGEDSIVFTVSEDEAYILYYAPD